MKEELDGIRARAEAYASHGTPGLRAPQDRAQLLAAIDAVLSLADGMIEESTTPQYGRDIKWAIRAGLKGAEDE